MKTHPISQWITALLLAAPLATAQEPVKIAETPYEVIERGPHERVWQREVQWQGPEGRVSTETHSYIETHTGMHYWEDEQWKESQELIEVFEQGAVARHGQTKVIFSPAIDDPEGSVIIETPDGQTLRTGILALNFTDPISGEQVTLGIIKESYGELLPPNRIIYPDAFDGVKADVIYTYTKRGITQDVLLLEQPPAPELLGLSEESRLEIMTEIFEAQEPEKRLRVLRREEDPVKRDRMAMPDFVDEELYFGELVIGPGRAFWQNADPGEEPELGEGVAVAKRWFEGPDGRRVLIESASHLELEPLMEGLPEFGEEEARALPEKGNGIEAGRYVPERQVAQVREAKPVLVAQAGVYSKQGLNLDYTTLNSSQTNYTFKGDTTYYITGTVDLYGTTTLEGGSVIKYDKYDSFTSYFPRIYVRESFDCQTDPYRPAIFTAKHDNSVGEVVATGTLSGPYAYTTIWFIGTGEDVIFEHAKIKHGQFGALFNGNPSNAIRHTQIIGCKYGIYANGTPVQAHNILIDEAANYGLYLVGGATIRGEHLTVHDAAELRSLGTGTSLYLTNSLFVDVSTIGSFTGSHNATNASYADAFQTVGSGAFYLKSGSPHRDAGTTSINADLQADLRKKTTSPPVVMSGSLSSDATWHPQAQRDTDTPDLGYHYDPLDYIVSGYTLNSGVTLTLAEGTALGVDYGSSSWGFILKSANLVSRGSPTTLNRIVRAHAVQETGTGNPGSRAFFYDGSSSGADCGLDFRFTGLSEVSSDGYLVYVGTKFSTFNWQDCQIVNGALLVNMPASVTWGLTNNLWGRTVVVLDGTTGSAVQMWNNTFYNNCVIHLKDSTTSWVVKDNLFDTVVVTNFSNPMTHTHNGYYSTIALTGTTSDNVPLSQSDFESGPLGDHYLVDTSDLIDSGSRAADTAGLYHYTTQVDQVKEGTSTIDIGFHYVSMDPKEGLVGYWRLDEGTGTAAADDSGYGHDGTLLNGAAWTTGQVDGSINFDGSNDYVTTTESSELRITGDLTIAFWMKKNSEAGSWVRMVGKGGNVPRNYGVWEEPGGTRLLFQAYNSGGGLVYNLFSTSGVSTGVWYHVAAVVDGTTARIYLNGSQDASTTFSGTPVTSTDPVTLAYAGYAGYYPGALDDVRIYNRALSAEEIGALAVPGISDTDGDGVPDYLEDSNGNGSVNSGETDWTSATDLGLEVQITRPRSSSALP